LQRGFWATSFDGFVTFWLVQPEAEQVQTGFFLRRFFSPLPAVSPSANPVRGATNTALPRSRVRVRRERIVSSHRATLSNRSPSMLVLQGRFASMTASRP
jgi:hypothetical protein